jgi:hypothetical protein
MGISISPKCFFVPFLVPPPKCSSPFPQWCWNFFHTFICYPHSYLVTCLFKSFDLMAHACNPSYSGGRDQEDWGLKPAWQIVPETLSRKCPTLKRIWQSVRPWVQALVHQKKKKSFAFLLFFLKSTGSCCVVQAALELTILLPQLRWDMGVYHYAQPLLLIL